MDKPTIILLLLFNSGKHEMKNVVLIFLVEKGYIKVDEKTKLFML